ncbi:putative RNA helicase [Rosa chinensis]|uniref:Putative RNA helicase n=1 Tax=Rosa chinensis TaxID=74649 RepID=A0A2P6RJ50_ROSCH|nr:putative RNA helicase [Rosa chinensis]
MDSYTLKSVADLPAPFRACFNFRYFNSLQSECFPACFHSDVNMVVSAPTGSGKTKFDAVSLYRVKDGGLGFFSNIAVLLIDEVHLLNDPRGAVLEAIVSRIKLLAHNPEMKSSSQAHVRFLTVSATIPNIQDIGYAPAKNDFLFEKFFAQLEKVHKKQHRYVLSQTVMAFGHSNPFIKSREQQERLREASLSCSDKQMQSYMIYAVGYHNGGLFLKDRNLIGSLLLKGDVQILCTTNTLAHGINLPAHTVVIKSTQQSNKEKGVYMEIDGSALLQMSGRAGLPPFDDTGMVIIMTRRDMVHLYENLLNGCEMVESQYIAFMFDGAFNCGDSYDCLLEFCIIYLLEYEGIQLRRNEKKLLNDINTDKDGRLRFHILGDKGKRKKRIQTREEKIFLLANDCLSGDPSAHDLSLAQDMNPICSNGCRIVRCMKEFFIYQKNYKGALNLMLLAKSMYQKLWDDSPYLLKQLPGIGMVTAKALHSMGVKSFETLAEADPRRIEIVTGRKYSFGNHIKESLLSLPPKVELKVEETECPGQGKLKLAVTLTRLSQTLQSTKRHYADMIVGSEEDNLILFHEKISPYSATVLLSNPQQGKLTVKADLIFEEYSEVPALIFLVSFTLQVTIDWYNLGIDLNRELILMKESNLSANNKRGKKSTLSSSP